MMYENFASLYDALMGDVPYEKWVHVVHEMKEKYGVRGNRFLDLACGTGELSIRFAKKGYVVTGVDLSSEMLTVAQLKAEKEKCQIQLFEQNMTELELLHQYDVIGIFCDSLNYLLTEEEVKETFQNVYNYLTEDGLFLFDVHSLYKIHHIFMDQVFSYDDGEICYIWHCSEGPFSNSVEHEITFFVQDDDGKYDRFDEVHAQRTFPLDIYRGWLEDIGFRVEEILWDFAEEQNDECERVLFIVRKQR